MSLRQLTPPAVKEVDQTKWHRVHPFLTALWELWGLFATVSYPFFAPTHCTAILAGLRYFTDVQVLGTNKFKLSQLNPSSLRTTMFCAALSSSVSTSFVCCIILEWEGLLASFASATISTCPNVVRVSWRYISHCVWTRAITWAFCCWDCSWFVLCAWEASLAVRCWGCSCSVLRLFRSLSAYIALEQLSSSSVWLLRRFLARFLARPGVQIRLCAASFRRWAALLSLGGLLLDLSIF